MTLADCGSQASAAGFVLAGGRSSRMGSDKALIELGGQALVARALEILREAGLTASIAGARTALGDYAPVIEDAGLGPLSGICAALASTSAELVVFTSVDLPFLPSGLVSALVKHARITGAAVTLASVCGYPQTFPVVLRNSARAALSVALNSGEGGCFAAFQAAATQVEQAFSIIPVEVLVQAGQVDHPRGLPAALWFLNVNTPRDLARAESLLAASIA